MSATASSFLIQTVYHRLFALSSPFNRVAYVPRLAVAAAVSSHPSTVISPKALHNFLCVLISVTDLVAASQCPILSAPDKAVVVTAALLLWNLQREDFLTYGSRGLHSRLLPIEVL